MTNYVRACACTLTLILTSCASTRPPLLLPPPPGPIQIRAEAAEAQLVEKILPRTLQWDTRAIVKLEVAIDKEGNVSGLKLLLGHPLLNEVTLAAVRQWRYKPFLRNGQPTEAITTVSVGYDFGRFFSCGKDLPGPPWTEFPRCP